MSTPPKCLGDAVERPAYRQRIRHVAFNPQRRSAKPLGCSLRALDIEQHDLGPGSAHRPGRGKADRSGAAGHDRDLTGERLLAGLAELRLLQRPVFDLEEVGFAD